MGLKKNITLSLFILSQLAFAAKGPDTDSTSRKPKDVVKPSLAAGCAPSNELIFLEYNNVRTRVETGGKWWQDRANNVSDYEVPKGSNSFALYAGGLWLAGTDVNGQLKAAASLYGSGDDFWTGPLDTTGNAEIDPSTCERWDRFYEIEKQDVLQFLLYRRSVEAGTVNEDYPDNYQVPDAIQNWPANGDLTRGQANRLAPFVDVNGDNYYDYNDGDYPYYDLGSGFNNAIADSLLNENGAVDCRKARPDRSQSAARPLFGDKTYWWIFNDKGNLHTETNAPSIGMEIHGQAFAFATNDAINDMTFYNFELINRSTFTLTDTYFASYVDPDLGYAFDDYVGCDVERGFGFCYNGDDFDEDNRGQTGYGSTPAVIGIDFFEGPYQDFDGIDNEVGIGPGQALNGLGYGDGVADNERFGMRRFVYYNNTAGQNGDPSLAIHYYNYMRGIWQNGQRMRHGGNGLNTAGVENIATAFMFPGDSDPKHWGTTGENGNTLIPTNTNWTESNPGGGQSPNTPGDRRFLQSAGPFTLQPGNVNDITVGVVFAQAESGGVQASLDKSIVADDLAQALFDNCFQVLDGPDAPNLEVQELDRELLFYLRNPELSNNYNEGYEEVDPNIITPDTLRQQGIFYDSTYRFQGYQVYQLSGPDISVSELGNQSVSRLVFQCDIADGVSTLTNYTFDEELGANLPVTRVVGQDEGVLHSFRVTEDLFAQGNSRLVNYKTYYFIAIAYAYNEFKPYAQDQAPDPSNALAPAYDGQKIPYLASRKSADGGAVESISVIPHSITPERGGTVSNSSYGDLSQISRLQGKGNGNRALELTDETIDRIMTEKHWENPNTSITRLDYKIDKAPITVKVVDPLNVRDGSFFFQMLDTSLLSNNGAIVTDSAYWKVWMDGSTDTTYSSNIIRTRTEQLFFDPNWGLSLLIEEGDLPGEGSSNNGFIDATVEYADPGKPWLTGIPDNDGYNAYNWILSGGSKPSGSQNENPQLAPWDDRTDGNGNYIDPDADYESILNGTVAPFRLVAEGARDADGNVLLNRPAYSDGAVQNASLAYLNSTVLVFTKDKSKWTRSPVIEMQEETNRAINGDEKYEIRTLPSVDKNGNPWRPGDSVDLNNPDSPSYIDSLGMGWFPGYAINVETGERLNIAFGEDSWYGVDKGGDMMWNPTSREQTGAEGNLAWGGKHVIYIFRKSLPEENIPGGDAFSMPEYDGGRKFKTILSDPRAFVKSIGWGACNWVLMPLLVEGEELLATETKVHLQVTRPFAVDSTDLSERTISEGYSEPIRVDSSLDNRGKPVYAFKTEGIAVDTSQAGVLKDALEEINVVPNPYYAISDYETSALDNRVKFINLPEVCNIKIYNMSGTLIREYRKNDPLNYLDWDLSNQVGIPIASGVYIVHIDVPGVGEKILKWFGVMRPVDLNNF